MVEQLNMKTDPDSVKLALELMGDLQEGEGTLTFTNAVARCAQGLPSEIYGSGGFHRYYVRECGRVDFSCPHSWGVKESRDARDLGFCLFPSP